MYWQDDTQALEAAVPDDIIDVQFGLAGRQIPVDHAFALGLAIAEALPVAAETLGIGLHLIHGAGSQNGWERPAHGTDRYLMLSRRAKLVVRVPKAHATTLEQALCGRALDVAGCALVIGDAKHRPLSKETTLFARHVLDAQCGGETEFLQWAAAELQALGIRIRKAVCGKATPLWTPDGPLLTRSLLLASLSRDDAILLQQRGLGPRRAMGCGLFIPHKGIDAVQDRAQ